MFKNNIRPYEMSVWTLQDGFITVLKGIGLENKGQIMAPKCSIKNDGTQELFFSIPMYYRENGVLVENPNWYNTRNGVLLINLRKIKVIFNKGEIGEEVFEFVINKITETHKDGQMYCEVTAEGLAFQELGKIGYKKSLTSADFYADYEDWYEKGANSGTEPKPSLRYWCEKVFNNSNWTYLIEMDWSGYDGIIVENINVKSLQNNETYIGSYKDAPAWARKKFNDERESSSRRLDTVYEDEYVSSWDANLAPEKIKPFEEKYRLPNIEKSNMYNITQSLAEVFGVYCKYKYSYDSNYHIIERKCIFYNQYFEEQDGATDITYPYHTSEIKREIDSSDTITKMYVIPIEDENLLSGQVNIAEEPANPTYEDYVMNFDYLYSIGTITKEQYDEVPVFQKNIRNFNIALESLSNTIADLQEKIVEYSAKQKILQEQIQLDNSQISKTKALINSITDTGVLSYSKDDPYKAPYLKEDDGETYYVKIAKEGVKNNSNFGIYYYSTVSEILNPIELDGSQYIFNEENFIIGLKGITLPKMIYSKYFYLTFEYQPLNQYNAVLDKYNEKLLRDTLEETRYSSLLSRVQNQLETREKEYQQKLKDKEQEIANFERFMGTAIREGSWQPDSYNDYGSKKEETILTEQKNNSDILNFFYDKTSFTGQQLKYIGIETEQNYYNYIIITKDIANALVEENLLNLDGLNTICLYHTATKKYFQINSDFKFSFLSDKTPILIILNTDNFSDPVFQIGRGTKNNFSLIGGIQASAQKFNSTTQLCYPRIEIKSSNLKTSENELKVFFNNIQLKKYYNYSVLTRGKNFYITLDPSYIFYSRVANLFSKSSTQKIKINYTLSNASLALYLDAVNVLNNNLLPKTSYTVTVSALNENFISTLYNKLNKIVNINDVELKFNNVKGYISEIEMNLDEPWEDEVKIQNYKTKFEDLFSSIVASTEQMKYNSFSYGIAGGAFTSSGTLKPSVIQSTLNRVDLSLAFNSGNLTIDEINGIWAISDEGVVAMKGGGIFCATEKDSYGNWDWSTGITPSGINASLLNAGQIDTNLIRIYGGNNLRFMLNADGLFAYAEESKNKEDFNTYVVHNSDGLFLTRKNQTITDSTGTPQTGKTINQVEVSWDGLIIRDINTGNSVFYADKKGNLNLEGFIKAKGGTIGGWDITEDALVSGSKYGKISLQAAPEKDTNDNYTAEAYNAITITKTILEGSGTNNITTKEETIFSVSSEGLLTAKNAVITGKIVATNMVEINTDELVAKNAIMDFNGVELGIYNRNLDGNLTYSPYSLDFVLIANYNNIGKLTLKIDAGENSILEEKIENLIANNYNERPEWLSISNNLTFNITYGIIQQIEKISGVNINNFIISFYEGITDENGKSEDVLIAEKEVFIKRYNVDKKFGLTPVISYFTEKDEDGATSTITVTLENITIGENNASIQYFFNGEEFSNGKTLPNGIIIGKDEENNNIIIVSKNYFTNNDVPTTLSIQVVLTLDGITYTRNASVSLTKNGISAGLYSVVITSTKGEIFKNGQIQTYLTANLYKGAELLNGEGTESAYTYRWLKDGEVLENIDEDGEENDRVFNEKTIHIKNKDFFNKAIYECEISYATKDELEGNTNSSEGGA